MVLYICIKFYKKKISQMFFKLQSGHLVNLMETTIYNVPMAVTLILGRPVLCFCVLHIVPWRFIFV